MDDNQPKSGGQNDDKAADAAEIDPLYLDQGYIDPDTGEFVPARMEESEEARKKRLAEEKHLSSEANGDNEGGAEGNNE